MKHLKDKSKLQFKHLKKTAALFIALASASITESFAASDTLAVTDVQSKFISASADKAIKGQYIVVLKDKYIDQQTAAVFGRASINSVSAMNYRRNVVKNTAIEMANSHNVTVKRQFHAALSGFAAQMTKKDMRALLADNRVEFIEQDQIMSTNSVIRDPNRRNASQRNVTQRNATYGLDRIDQKKLPLDAQYKYSSIFDGSGVRAYVIDTGIFVAHPDFGDRAENGWDFVDNDNVANDCNGHGTHVAGTIGSSTYGVAKNVTLIGVRVIGCGNEGATSAVIAGIDWVAQNAIRPAVVNLSIGGGTSRAEDAAVQNVINKGITVVVAAGNSNSDACTGSPARVADALTVASSTSTDARSASSSWGTCVDIFAPGSNITSTWNNGGSVTISGTSMAAPHVAGAVALELDQYPTSTPATAAMVIKSRATFNVLSDIGEGSPNRLLYAGFRPVCLHDNTDTGKFYVGTRPRFHPRPTGFYSAGAGQLFHSACMNKRVGKNFTLILRRWDGRFRAWLPIAYFSADDSSAVFGSYFANNIPGPYSWVVGSPNGAVGEYTLNFSMP